MRALAPLLGARLIDNHSVYNVGLSLTVFKSPAFYEAVRSVRAVAGSCIAYLPPETPLIMTNAHFATSDWGSENWEAFNGFARQRGLPLAVVVLDCSRVENMRRIAGESRIGKGALRDPALVPEAGQGRTLLAHGGDWTLHLDVTDLSAAQAAAAIRDWLQAMNR